MFFLPKVHDLVRSEGVSGLAHRSIAYAYRQVRPWMPNKAIRYSGIPTCYDGKWGDHLVPKTWVPDSYADEPGYEATLLAALNETVRPGDHVVIIGGGVGVTAVVAALRTGSSGIVQCFEGSKHYVRMAHQTVARNRIANIEINHAVVAKFIAALDGGVPSDLGPILSPSQLPPCNVLQMDCEGAEVGILNGLIIQPRVIVVETHGVYGAPTDLVASLLEKRGYVVSDRGVAEPRMAEYHTKLDVRVLVGMIRFP
jgi:threonine dehydrogenase-like Zn-dependent dehydrogenase